MNHELTKQLIDAGWKWTKVGWNEGFFYKGNYYSNDYTPTLSELIEACGDRFKALERAGQNKWLAVNKWDDDRIIIFANTPEEAVARLWLELNKSNN